MVIEDQEYWQRLRKDKRTAWAVGMVALCALLARVGLGVILVPGPQHQARGNPLYLLLMAPLVWWGSSLAWYEEKAARLIRPAFIMLPPLCGINALWAVSLGMDPAIHVGALAACTIFAALGWWLHKDSMLRAEGPAR